MAWLGIEGHDEAVERFRTALKRGRLASSFLFLGPEGVGKRLFAERLAKALLCLRNEPEMLEPCGTCESCRMFEANEHPDIIRVSKPADRAFIPIETLIGAPENRMREGLCAELNLKPTYQKRKIAIIDDADYLNIEGANAMLKTLEEPPKNSVLILIGTSAGRQLPTIRSRCQAIWFAPLKPTILEAILRAHAEEWNVELGRIPALARHACGSVVYARALADSKLWDFRSEFLFTLAGGPIERVQLGKTVEAQLDAAGKQPALRRDRLRIVMEMTAMYYRNLARFLVRMLPENEMDATDWDLYHRAAMNWKFDAEGAALAAMRTSDRIELLQRNVNMNLLLDAWLDELVRFGHGDRQLLVSADWTLRPGP